MAILLLLTGALVMSFPSPARALTIDQTDINTQTEVVKAELVSTLEEYVKLLQMVLITKLQAKLATLQAGR